MKLHLLLLLALSTESKWVKKPTWKQQWKKRKQMKLTDLTDNEHTTKPEKIKNFIQPDVFKQFIASEDVKTNVNSPAYSQFKTVQRSKLENLLNGHTVSANHITKLRNAPTAAPQKYLANLSKEKRMGPAAQRYAAHLRAKESLKTPTNVIRRRTKAPTMKPKMKNKIYTIPSRSATAPPAKPKTTIAPLNENGLPLASQPVTPTGGYKISIIPKKIKKAAKYAKKGNFTVFENIKV